MPVDHPSRRSLLAGGAVLLAVATVRSEDAKPKSSFNYCLNTSTIRRPVGDWGKPRPIIESIDIAAKAGYTAIEPWIQELDEYTQRGGTLKDLKKRFSDAGLVVPNAIGFAEWIVEDPARRKKGLDQAKRDMDTVQRVGGTRIAAPPVGATGGKPTEPAIDLLAAADRYRDLWELGRTMGVTPIVEVWGFSRSLSRLGETALVAMECGKDGGAVLPDVYHLYKGGSDFAGLSLLAPAAIGIFHVNDYPAIERGKIGDADRVYPGDGVAPLVAILKSLRAIGYAGYLSVELFNRGYWKLDPHTVAKTAREKLQAVIAKV